MIAIVLPPGNAIGGIPAADQRTAVSRNPKIVPTGEQGGDEKCATERSAPFCEGGALDGQFSAKSQEFGLFMNSATNALKTAGESLTTAARKGG